MFVIFVLGQIFVLLDCVSDVCRVCL